MPYSVHLAIVLMALLTGDLHAEQAQPPLSVVVVSPDPHRAAADGGQWTFDTSSGRLVTRELGVGQTPEGGTLHLLPADETQDRYRVQVQFETRETVFKNEPGGDVLDLKRFNSEWLDAQALTVGRFRLPTFPERDRRRYSEVSAAESFVAALARESAWWTLPVSPAMVDTSTIRVRVLTRADATWSEVITIAFKIPMPVGC